jgi:DNA-binding Xre family transcriptional regulator
MGRPAGDNGQGTQRVVRSDSAEGRHQRQIRFDTEALIEDFIADCKRRRISRFRACMRIGVPPTSMSRMVSGKISDVTVHTLARLMAAMNKTDISKYIIEEE